MSQFLILLILGMTLTSAHSIENDIEVQQRLISEQVIDSIEHIKKQMPCGFPRLGIPPLAPFLTTHQNISVGLGKIIAQGEIDDFRLDGLNDFDIRNFTINVLTNKMKFDFLWKRIHLNTKYLIDTTMNKLALLRSGNATIVLTDFTVWGNIRYNINLLSGHLKLKELKLYLKLDKIDFNIEGLSNNSFLNNKLNDLMEEWVTLVINDNTDHLAEFTNGLLMPIINNIIADMDILSILLSIASGGSGESCIPTEIDFKINTDLLL